MPNHNMQQFIQAVEDSILPGGYLLLGFDSDEENEDGVVAVVGKIGMVGEWRGAGATDDEAIQAAVKAAEEDDDA